ncbi:MAG: hypothetical protein K6T30_09320 [Alicyclobacillus sp.]|nr:hypothetical protein [Alicyclobacillus sp.]
MAHRATSGTGRRTNLRRRASRRSGAPESAPAEPVRLRQMVGREMGRRATAVPVRVDPSLRWSVVFLMLFVRFAIAPATAYGEFLNLVILVSMLLLPPNAERWVIARVLFLLAIFFALEAFSADTGDYEKRSFFRRSNALTASPTAM